MGIRVDKEALLRQLEICNAEEKKELYFHKRLLNNELPLSIGGGIACVCFTSAKPISVKFKQVYGRKKCVVKPVLPVCT